MTAQVTSVGRLTTDQVKSVLRSAVLAPSTHNTQPWRFRCTSAGIEVHADPGRALPVADADQRELVLSCGAALFNLRIAIHALGIHPATTLLPRRDKPDLLAVVRPFAMRPDEARITRLARVIPHRHTNRRPFTLAVVPPSVVGALRRAAEIEHAWLPSLDAAMRRDMHDLVRKAYEHQLADPAFLAEWAAWTGRDRSSRDGVPFYATGATPSVNDEWVVCDFAPRTDHGRQPTRTPAAEPLVVVIGSFHDGRVDRLRAGQAMQRVLLTATEAGLDVSFISQPVEVPSARAQLREMLGGGLWPQTVLRVGYGSPVPWTTLRRPLEDVLLSDEVLTT
jgi:nitroreductase